MPRVVDCPNYLESKDFGGFAWVVTATPRVMPLSPCLVPQWLVKDDRWRGITTPIQ
jgi:hypothetical protein